MEVKLPDAAAREDILTAHLRRHTLQHAFGEGAVDKELMQVLRLLPVIKSAWPCLWPFAQELVLPTVRLPPTAQCAQLFVKC